MYPYSRYLGLKVSIIYIYIYRDPFKAKVPTIWAHGVLGLTRNQAGGGVSSGRPGDRREQADMGEGFLHVSRLGRSLQHF